jgi:hypothetical protein
MKLIAMTPYLLVGALLVGTHQACTIANELSLPNKNGACRTSQPSGYRDAAGSDISQADLVFATRTVAFSNDAGPVGYDLDNACVCGTSCRRRKEVADCGRPDGIDNQGIALEQSLPGISLAKSMAMRISTGMGGFLIVVSGYNGEPNDSNVEVQLFPSNGLRGDAGVVPPQFTEADRWLLGQNATISDGGIARANDRGTGYVTNGQLVARFSKVLFAFNRELAIDLTDVVVTGQFVLGAKTLLPEVVLAGRWQIDDALRNVLRFQFNGSALCTSAVGLLVPDQLCPLADITANPKASPQETCDALSFGIAMTLAPGSLGDFLPPEPPIDVCEKQFAPTACP